MDRIAQITVDKVTNSRMHFGPVEGSIFLRDCENCIVTVCCGQFRAKNCKNLYIFLYSNSDPSIEYSTGLVFGPYNFSYPLQDTHFIEARLNINHDVWSQVFDFNKSDEEHWRIMNPEEFKLMLWEKDELGVPVNPIPRHKIYGGEMTDDIKIGSQQHGEQGLMSFGIDTLKDQNVFSDIPQATEDIFADTAQTSNVPVYFVPDNTDFTQDYQPPPGAAYSQSDPVVDTEELERQRLRDLENIERNKRLINKDKKERLKKDEKRKRKHEKIKRKAAKIAIELQR